MSAETCLSCGFRGGLHHALCEKQLEKLDDAPPLRTSAETMARERLIAQVAVLKGVDHKDHEVFDVDTAWKRGEEFVAALEAKPDEAVQCPCCEKLVTLCLKHYQLHEPGKPCIDCRRAAG